MKSIFTISNLLSLLRIVLLIPIAMLMINDVSSNRVYILSLMVVAALTDTFDGILARKFNQVTEFGKIIDPLADKIAIGVVVIILLTQRKLPPWFVIITVIRDLIILSGGLYIKKIKNKTLQSTQTGKWAATIIAFLIIITVADFQELILVKEILIYISTLMLFLSFVVYLERFVREIRSANIIN